MPESEAITDNPRRRSMPVTQAPVSVARMMPQSVIENLPKGAIANQPLPPQDVPPPQDTPGSVEEMIRRAERPSSQTASGQTPAQPLQRQLASIVPASPVQSSAAPAAEMAAADSVPGDEGPSEALEQDWSRLQTIMRRHQEAEQEEGPRDQAEPDAETGLPQDPSVTRPDPGAVQRKAITRESQTPQTPPGIRPQKARITELEPHSQPQAPRGSSPIPQPADQQEAAVSRPPAHPEAVPVQTQPVSEENEQEKPSSQQPPRSAVLTSSQDLIEASQQPTIVSSPSPIQPTGEPSQDKDDIGMEKPVVQPKPETSAARPTPMASNASEMHDTHLTGEIDPGMTYAAGLVEMEDPDSPENEQVYPLESAWPVQRKAQDPQADIPRSAPQQAPIEQSTPVSLPDPQEIQQMQEMIGAIAVKQPTDSHVEVITPRKPRPAVSGSAPRLQRTPEQTAKPDMLVPVEPEDSFSETPVQTKPVQPAASETEQQRTESSQSEPFQYGPTMENTPEPDAQVVQREVKEQEGSPAQMVETEIGPLPADLWHLVGTTPPEDKIIPAAAPSGEHTETTPPQPVQTRPLGEPALRASALPAVKKTTAGKNGAALIQRIAQETTTQAPADTGSPSPSSGEEDTQETGEAEEQIDTDELARKVYSYIKRKLMVEWERLRKRT